MRPLNVIYTKTIKKPEEKLFAFDGIIEGGQM
jgi:hypothetical protein